MSEDPVQNEDECIDRQQVAEDWLDHLLTDKLGIGDLLILVGNQWQSEDNRVDSYQLWILIRLLVRLLLQRDPANDEQQERSAQVHFFLHLFEDLLDTPMDVDMPMNEEFLETLLDLVADTDLTADSKEVIPDPTTSTDDRVR
jgi:hypothetical protein